MSTRITLTAVALGAVAILALSGCNAGASTGTSDHPNSLIDAACVPGTWAVDMPGLVQAVVDALPENVDVIGQSITGTQTYTFTADQVTKTNDFTLSVTYQLDDHSYEITQGHKGTLTSNWSMDAQGMTFSNTVNNDVQTSTASVDGSQIGGGTAPAAQADGFDVPIETVCRGNGMTLAPNASEDLVVHLSRVEG